MLAESTKFIWISAALVFISALLSAQSPTSNLGNPADAFVEGCNSEKVFFDFSSFNSNHFPISFDISGDAETGLDYEIDQANGSISENNPIIELSIVPINDNLSESPEFIVVNFQSIAGYSESFSVPIIDPLTYSLTSDTTICAMNVTSLEVDLTPPPFDNFSFSWSTGETGDQIFVVPSFTTEYSLAISNNLSTCLDTVKVSTSGVGVYSQITEFPCSDTTFSAEVSGQVFDIDFPSGFAVVEDIIAGGCDLVIFTELIFSEFITIDTVVCEGECFVAPGGTQLCETGTYDLVLENVLGDSCDIFITVNLEVLSVLMIDSSIVICEGDCITDPNGQEICEEGSYEYFLSGNQGSCDTTLVLNVQQGQIVELDSFASICVGEVFIAPDGSELSETGLYAYPIDIGTACDAILNIDLEVLDLPTAQFVQPFDTLCKNTDGFLEVSLEGMAPWSISITQNQIPTVYDDIQQSPFMFPVNLSEDTQFIINGTSDNQCSNSSTDTVNVIIIPLPNAEAAYNSPLCYGQQLLLFGNGGTEWEWTGPDGFVSNEQNPVIQSFNPEQEGVYQLKVDSICASDSATIIVNEDCSYFSESLLLNELDTFCWEGTLIATEACGGPVDAVELDIDEVNNCVYIFSIAFGADTICLLLDIDGELVANQLVIQVLDPNATQTIGNSAAFQLFPNPANNRLQISSDRMEISRVEVYSIGGMLKWAQNFRASNNFNINVSSLPSGLFIVKLVTGKGVFYSRFEKL